MSTSKGQGESLRYSIFDPTGNITALVESDVEIAWQPAVAAQLMQRHPEVEQVGFVRVVDPPVCAGGVEAELRMAGGEFCGNATMSAAAWYLLQDERAERASQASDGGEVVSSRTVHLRVSGASRPVEVRLTRIDGTAYEAGVCMPQAYGVQKTLLSLDDTHEVLPVVEMEGISHIVIATGSAFSFLRENPQVAERAVRTWCEALGADGLGLMFVDGDGSERSLLPLVYIPGGDTLFWEHSCASGSAAVGRYLAEGATDRQVLWLREPGGALRVECDAPSGETWLYGTARLTYRSR